MKSLDGVFANIGNRTPLVLVGFSAITAGLFAVFGIENNEGPTADVIGSFLAGLGVLTLTHGVTGKGHS